MKTVLKSTLFIAVAAFVLSSCSKTNDTGKMIPADAMFVLHINTKSLSSKLTWDEIKATSWYKLIYADTSVKDWMKKILDNPENSGINTKTEMVFFIHQPDGGNGSVIIEGDVKDAGVFEAFNKNMSENSMISKEGDINTMNLMQEAVVGWNSKKFVYAFNAPFLNAAKNMMDTTAYTAPAGADIQKLSRVCKSMFALKADSSLSKNEKFTALLKEDGDLHFWQNTEQIMKLSPAMGMMGMLKMDAFLKGNISVGTLNFENGSIKGNQKMYGSKELIDILKKYGGGEINTEMIKNIPSQNVAGLMSIHFKPEGLAAFVKLTGMDGLINMALMQVGFSIDDFVAANKGDVMFSVSDITVPADSTGSSKANFLFSVEVGDQASFQKLLNAGVKLGGQMNKDSGIYYARNEKYFVLGNNKEAVNGYNAKPGNSFSFLDKIKDHPFAMFIDINKILTSISASPKHDSVSRIVLQESIKMWQDVYVTGGEIKNDAYHVNSEVNLADKTINSLKQLNNYFDRIVPLLHDEAARRKQHADYNMADSTLR